MVTGSLDSDTDSDVDSATLDDDDDDRDAAVDDARSSSGWPMSGRTSVKTLDTDDDDVMSTDAEGGGGGGYRCAWGMRLQVR